MMWLMLSNLVRSARETMPRGGTIWITTADLHAQTEFAVQERILPPGRYAMLSVTDNGTGRELTSHWRPVENWRTAPAAGRRLAAVRSIVEECGGGIFVRTDREEGTTVTLYLPAQERATAGESATPLGWGGTILLVDADTGARNRAIQLLQGLGYRVLVAGSGSEALETSACLTRAIDLLITTRELPDMQGQQLAEQRRASKPRLATLYLSAVAEELAGATGHAPATAELLQKPFEIALLAQRVQHLMSRRRRVLVIDDDPAILRLAEMALTEADFEVMSLENGARACETVLHHEIDVVLTDLVMPEHEGLETIRQLHELYPTLPIIAMSGAFQGRFLEPSRFLGASSTLLKPFTIEQLVETVRRAVSLTDEATG